MEIDAAPPLFQSCSILNLLLLRIMPLDSKYQPMSLLPTELWMFSTSDVHYDTGIICL